MNAALLAARTDDTLTASEIKRIARACGADAGCPHDRDVMLWGPRAAVRKTLAVMGFGFDTDRRGAVQRLYDGTGRAWGNIAYCDKTGRASVTLFSLLSPR